MGSLASAGAGLRSAALASPNDTVRVACVGVHGQGRTHIRRYSEMRNVEIAAICDVDESVLNARVAELEKAGKKRPAAFTDLRKLLEDKTIDAISIATPNHQHTLQTVWACQAGKDVYVEKPCSHDMFEAKQIVSAAQKYNRLVQHGTNCRSNISREAIKHMHGCGSVWLKSEAVTEMFDGKIAWQGEVQIFALLGHPTAKLCYAWSHQTDGGKRRFVAVLGLPPVDSAVMAVRASIAASR